MEFDMQNKIILKGKSIHTPWPDRNVNECLEHPDMRQ